MKRTVSLLLACTALMLAACSERPQVSRAGADPTPAWTGTASPSLAPDFKPGDRAAWEQQLRQRARNQNELLRTGARSS